MSKILRDTHMPRIEVTAAIATPGLDDAYITSEMAKASQAHRDGKWRSVIIFVRTAWGYACGLNACGVISRDDLMAFCARTDMIESNARAELEDEARDQ